MRRAHLSPYDAIDESQPTGPEKPGSAASLNDDRSPVGGPTIQPLRIGGRQGDAPMSRPGFLLSRRIVDFVSMKTEVPFELQKVSKQKLMSDL